MSRRQSISFEEAGVVAYEVTQTGLVYQPSGKKVNRSKVELALTGMGISVFAQKKNGGAFGRIVLVFICVGVQAPIRNVGKLQTCMVSSLFLVLFCCFVFVLWFPINQK